MSKQELVRSEMVKSMKKKDKPKKETLSLLLAALKNAEIDKMGILSESEEDAVVQKEIKQTKETLDLAPADRTDIIQECKYRIEVLSQFAPKMMTEEEIEVTIAGVLSDLGIENPTKKEKGKIMKTLMPMVKGKADGKLAYKALQCHGNAGWKGTIDFQKTFSRGTPYCNESSADWRRDCSKTRRDQSGS